MISCLRIEERTLLLVSSLTSMLCAKENDLDIGKWVDSLSGEI
jgi:hypothetical protein